MGSMIRLSQQVLLLLGQTAVIISSSRNDGVAVLGLGGMGSAVAKCLAAHPIPRSVHAWNRSPPRNGQDLSSTTQHTSMSTAVGNATTILVVIDNWEGAKEVTRSVVDVWERNSQEVLSTRTPTVIVFSTYTPHEIQEFVASTAGTSSVHLVGGAIVGVPETICSKASLVLLSSSSTRPLKSTTKELLDPLGTAISIDGGDVGSASLLNISLILTITFGIAGSELALLMLRAASTDQAVLAVYSQLAQDVAIPFISMLLPFVTKSIADESFGATYVPAMTLHALLQKVCHYLHESLNIKDETFLDYYVLSLGQVHDPRDGPLAWTKPYLELTKRVVESEEL